MNPFLRYPPKPEKLKVIVPLDNVNDDRNVRDCLARHFSLDFTDVLELALTHWTELQNDDSESKIAALEHSLFRRLKRRHASNFRTFIHVLELALVAAEQMQAHLQPIITPVMEAMNRTCEFELRLVGWTARAAIIELKVREAT